MKKNDNPQSSLLRRQLREFPDLLDALLGAAALHLGLNKTDLQALRVIVDEPGITASRLAERMELTPGAITAVLDRAGARALRPPLPGRG